MTTDPGSQPPLKVDPDLLGKYGGQLLSAAGDLPSAPPPFTVTGADAISQAIAEKLPGLEGPIQEALPQLKDEASTTANNVVTAAGRYSDTDAQLAADYEKHEFDSVAGPGGRGSGGGAGSGGGTGQLGQMGQMMSMPMQMASQAAQVPMQAMSALGQVPQGVMQGVQQIGQMTGGIGGSSGAGSDVRAEKPTEDGLGQQDDHRAEREASHGAAARDATAERAPEPPSPVPPVTPVPQRNSPRHAASDPTVDL